MISILEPGDIGAPTVARRDDEPTQGAPRLHGSRTRLARTRLRIRPGIVDTAPQGVAPAATS